MHITEKVLIYHSTAAPPHHPNVNNAALVRPDLCLIVIAGQRVYAAITETPANEKTQPYIHARHIVPRGPCRRRVQPAIMFSNDLVHELQYPPSPFPQTTLLRCNYIKNLQ